MAGDKTLGSSSGKGNEWPSAKSVSVDHSGRLGRHNLAKRSQKDPRPATFEWGSGAIGNAVAFAGKLTATGYDYDVVSSGGETF